MANAGMRVAGPCENVAFFNKYLAGNSGNPLFEALFLTNLNHYPFTGQWISDEAPTMGYLVYYGRSIMLNGAATVDRDAVYTALLGDVSGPVLPTRLLPDQARSREIFVRSVKSLVRANQLQTLSVHNLGTYMNHIADANNVALYAQEGPGADNRYGQFTDEDVADVERMTFPQSLRILYHIALGTNVAYKISGLGLICNITVAICRRATVSEQFVTKVEKGIQQDLNKRVTLKADVINMYMRVFGQFINGTNIRVVKDRWATLIPGNALRLTLTVQQRAGSGMTAFLTIGKALRRYPDFPWQNALQYFPEEMTKYTEAVRAVAGNPYYGFNKDLGPARPTKFPNFAWVAKELLVKVGGETPLNQYAGWIRRVPYQAAIDQLIANYEETHGRLDIDEDDPEQVQPRDARLVAYGEMIDLISTPQNADLFI